MAHQIERLDTAMFSEKEAWHGKGIVVAEAPSPEEALTISGLDWEVGKNPIFREDRSLIRSHVETFREDTGLSLGVVGKNFEVVQNRQLFDFAYGVKGLSDDLKVETAFSMRNCRRVLVSIRADEFFPLNDDAVNMYLIVANGHDGSLTLVTYFSSTRVVCNNTFKASLSAVKRGEGLVKMRHEGDMVAKIEDAQRVLSAYHNTFNNYRKCCDAMVRRKMSLDEMKEFFLEAVMLMEGLIPSAEDAKKTKRAGTKREKCVKAYAQICENFSREAAELHSDRNAWLAFNACTKWMQHGRPTRGKDDAKAADNKVYSDQFGPLCDAKESLWKSAMKLAAV